MVLQLISYAPQGGRPNRLNPEQEAKLKEFILNKTPANVGFPANFNWITGIIDEYILKEYKVKYSIRGVTLILARLNLSCSCPAYTLAKADPFKQKQFRMDFDQVKRT